MFVMALTSCQAAEEPKPMEKEAQPDTGFSLNYWETLPQEQKWHVAIDHNGMGNVAVETLKAGCFDAWQASCWQTMKHEKQLSAVELDQLEGLFKNLDASALPNETEPPPGAAYLSFVLMTRDGRKITAASSLDQISQYPAVVELQSRMHALAE